MIIKTDAPVSRYLMFIKKGVITFNQKKEYGIRWLCSSPSSKKGYVWQITFRKDFCGAPFSWWVYS